MPGEVQGPSGNRKGSYVILTVLLSLSDRLIYHELAAEVIAMHRSGSSELWLQRPLSAKLIHYAATDIYDISLIYASFKKSKIVPASRSGTTRLLSRSQRYVAFPGRLERLDKSDIFRTRSKAILMAEALLPPRKSSELAFCSGCRYTLAPACFQSKHQGKALLERKSHCRLCEATALKCKVALEPTWIPSAV